VSEQPGAGSSDAGEQHDALGSAAEEAARLFEAMQGWAGRSSSGEGVKGLGGLALGLSDRVATGSSECQLCPLCQLIGLLKTSAPEVYEHLGQASTSLMAALRAAINAHEQSWAPRRSSDVEHIDIG
jgi:hypothetical protein